MTYSPQRPIPPKIQHDFVIFFVCFIVVTENHLFPHKLCLLYTDSFFWQELTHLMRLPVLCSLSLKDPLYSPSPVSLLCNYSTHVLFHLPNVTKLDTFDVSKTVVEVAEVSSLQTNVMSYYHSEKQLVLLSQLHDKCIGIVAFHSFLDKEREISFSFQLLTEKCEVL